MHQVKFPQRLGGKIPLLLVSRRTFVIGDSRNHRLFSLPVPLISSSVLSVGNWTADTILRIEETEWGRSRKLGSVESFGEQALLYGFSIPFSLITLLSRAVFVFRAHDRALLIYTGSSIHRTKYS